MPMHQTMTQKPPGKGGENMNLNASDIIRLVSSILELVAAAMDKSN